MPEAVVVTRYQYLRLQLVVKHLLHKSLGRESCHLFGKRKNDERIHP